MHRPSPSVLAAAMAVIAVVALVTGLLPEPPALPCDLLVEARCIRVPGVGGGVCLPAGGGHCALA